MWYRVFCRSNDLQPPPEIIARLRREGLAVEGSFNPNDRGWTTAELRLGAGTPVFVERYRTADDDLRNDLNTWAAVLETMDYSTNNVRLMEHVIQAQQMFTVRKPVSHANESGIEDLCRTLCMELAAADGVFQIEDDGWYSADAVLLLKEY